MSILSRSRTILIEHILPWAVLALLLTYVYGQVFLAPFVGFDFEPSTGEITQVFIATPSTALQAGDVIFRVDSVQLSEFHENLRTQLFRPTVPGDSYDMIILRAGQEHHIRWIVPGFNLREFEGRLINAWWLGFAFWLAGVATLLFIRPKNARWHLLVHAGGNGHTVRSVRFSALPNSKRAKAHTTNCLRICAGLY